MAPLFVPSLIFPQASDEWDRLPGDLRGEGVLLFWLFSFILSLIYSKKNIGEKCS